MPLVAETAFAMGDLSAWPALFAGSTESRPTGVDGSARCRRRASCFAERDAPQNGEHENAAYQSEGRHEIEITVPAFIEQPAEKVAGQAAAEVLKGINYAGSEPSHFRAADIHGCSRAQNRMRGVRRKRNQNEKQNH